MNKIEDLFQKRLEQLQNGRPLEECSAGLPEREAQLLALVAELDELDFPEPEQSKVALQRAQVLQRARAQVGKRRKDERTPRRAWPRWAAPALAVAVPLVLLIAFAWLAVAGVGIWWLRSRNADTPTALVAAHAVETQISSTPARSPATAASAQEQGAPSVPTRPMVVPRTREAPDTPTAEPALPSIESAVVAPPLLASDVQGALVRDVRGLVQVQGADAAWVTVEETYVVRAGEAVRTGALSSASLAFADGSVARLGPDSELGVDELDLPVSGDGRASGGARVIVLSQLSGESTHDVLPSAAVDARYAVNTVSGSGVAKGTRFQVRITPDQETHFTVDEGAILVSNQDTTVEVAAGQAAVVGADEPPSEPFFRITGEGEVQEIGSTAWTIAGQAFETHGGTTIVGNPQVGDWVRVEGRLLPDGTRMADLIVLAHRSSANRFEIQGVVEAIAETEWTIAGQAVAVDENTQIEAGIVEGDLVEAEGIVLAGGELLAEQIELVIEDAPGMPFEFVGIVQAMGDDAWTVSSRSIAVNDETVIEAGLAVGDLVQVEGWITPDGTWLAREIEREDEDERTFEFTGTVESTDPWIVSGILLATDEWTEIDPAIVDGDTVRVKGRILDNGSWLATEIRLLDEEPSYVEYIGQVESIDPWIVSGVELIVDDETEIEDEIVVDDWVRVRALILPDGAWLAVEIERLDTLPRGGCIWFSARVVEISPEQIVLDNGMTIDLHPGLEVEGDVQPGSVVMVQVCAQEDGTLTVVRIVAYEDEIPSATPTPQPRTVTICHKPGTPAQQTKLLPETAIPGHLGHGDTLGPCEGDEDLTPVAPTPDSSATPEVRVEICHKPGTPAEKTKLVPEIDLNDHLEHGDYLGACGEGGDLTPVAPTPDGSSTPEPRVTLCHKPGTPAQQTKLIPQRDVGDHLGHGDHLGACSEDEGGGKDKKPKKPNRND